MTDDGWKPAGKGRWERVYRGVLCAAWNEGGTPWWQWSTGDARGHALSYVGARHQAMLTVDELAALRERVGR